MHLSKDKLTSEEVKELLRKWRENNERKSTEISELFDNSFEYDLIINQSGVEKHLMFEQMAMSMLDTHEYPIADYFIRLLAKEFPGSHRVMKLQATQLEAEEKYGEAMEILDNIIKADETNAAARKRRVAIYKAQGQITEAIKELVDYLKKFMSDAEGWQQLVALYLQAGELARAAAAADELLLHAPHHHLHHQLKADILYTMGGTENMELAKSYYCQAAKLNPDNMRALLGIFLVTNNLMSSYKSSGNNNKRKELSRLNQWARAQCARQQARAHDAPVPALDQVMKALTIAD